jgi:hypothetical protein
MGQLTFDSWAPYPRVKCQPSHSPRRQAPRRLPPKRYYAQSRIQMAIDHDTIWNALQRVCPEPAEVRIQKGISRDVGSHQQVSETESARNGNSRQTPASPHSSSPPGSRRVAAISATCIGQEIRPVCQAGRKIDSRSFIKRSRLLH